VGAKAPALLVIWGFLPRPVMRLFMVWFGYLKKSSCSVEMDCTS